MDNLEKNEKYLCNILIKYINSRSCAVVLHNDRRQDCGHMGLKLHVHLSVDTTLPGDDRQKEKSAICEVDVFQIREKILTQKGKLDVQKIRNVPAFINHMIRHPRLFIGANNQVMRELFKWVKEQTINFLHISEANCLGELMTLQDPLDLRLHRIHLGKSAGSGPPLIISYIQFIIQRTKQQI